MSHNTWISFGCTSSKIKVLTIKIIYYKSVEIFFIKDVGIPVTDAIALNIGICVPHQCTGEDVEIITNQSDIKFL